MRRFVAALICVLGLTAPLAATADTMDEDRVRELVLDTILENPEVIMQAIDILRARDAEAQKAQAAQTMTSQREALERDPNAPVLGNPDGDVTLVEFFDYNCGYCRRVHPSVEALIAEDKNLRVVMREWPILGDASVEAARVSLAVRKQGKYAEFHKAMMEGRGRANTASALKVAEGLGLDIDQLRRDMEAPDVVAHLQLSQELSQGLGVNGTPAFVVGEQLVPGAIDLDQLRSLVAQARENG
ncbi:MAG: DsbA family protein [Litoreibacter sp.]|nr:DsbA family protein [Litoreibacter sp.]